MKIVAFDIESSSLDADWGRVLCASFCPIKEEGKTEQPYTLVRPVRTKDPLDDSALIRSIRDELLKYNLIVTWYGKIFDVPFINARLLKHSLGDYVPQMHLDACWYAAGTGMKLGSKRLDNVAKYFKTEHQKVDVEPEDWQRARYGDAEALQRVVEHCEADVQILSEVYWRLLPRVRNIHRGG